MYYVSFIYEFSRNTWIYFIGNKSKVFDEFKEFTVLVDIQKEKRIKVLMIDNGGDLYRNKFEYFYKNCGI
jgi:hypothetical protein